MEQLASRANWGAQAGLALARGCCLPSIRSYLNVPDLLWLYVFEEGEHKQCSYKNCAHTLQLESAVQNSILQMKFVEYALFLKHYHSSSIIIVVYGEACVRNSKELTYGKSLSEKWKQTERNVFVLCNQ